MRRKKIKITYKRLYEVLRYFQDDGVFRWKISRCGVKINSIAGYIDKKRGYSYIRVDGERYLVHRLAFLYMEGYWPENEIDHKDRNPSNNRWVNLRHITHSCNLKNSNVQKNNTSGVTGVYKFKKRFVSKINSNNKSIHIGYFGDFDDAVKARWGAEVKYGFNNCQTTSSAYLYLKRNNLL